MIPLKYLVAKIKSDYWKLRKNAEQAEERMSKWILIAAQKERIKELDMLDKTINKQ